MSPPSRPSRPASPRPALTSRGPAARPRTQRWLPLAVFVLVGAGLLVRGTVPWWLVAGYATMSVVTFWVYSVDKRAAVRGRRRVPERTLHRLALLGGWPGAAVAQQVLRHKTIKASFRTTFRWTVVVNVAVVALACSPLGRSVL